MMILLCWRNEKIEICVSGHFVLLALLRQSFPGKEAMYIMSDNFDYNNITVLFIQLITSITSIADIEFKRRYNTI